MCKNLNTSLIFKFFKGTLIHLLRIFLNSQLPLPPWHITNPACELHLLRYVTSKICALMYHCYSAHLENTALYTDRLCVQSLTGCDAVNKDQAFSYCLHNYNTVYLTNTYIIH